MDHSFDLCFLKHLILQRPHRSHEPRPPFPLDLLPPHLSHPHPVVLRLPSHPSTHLSLGPRLLSRLIVRLPRTRTLLLLRVNRHALPVAVGIVLLNPLRRRFQI